MSGLTRLEHNFEVSKQHPSLCGSTLLALLSVLLWLVAGSWFLRLGIGMLYKDMGNKEERSCDPHSMDSRALELGRGKVMKNQRMADFVE